MNSTFTHLFWHIFYLVFSWRCLIWVHCLIDCICVACSAGSDGTYGSKAAELNNATDDSETYTQKATNAAAAAKDKAAETLGLNQSSTGPSLLDQAKEYMGVAKDTTKDYSGSATDTTKDYAGKTHNLV